MKRTLLILLALVLVSCFPERAREQARAECVKMCEPRLVHRFDAEIDSCECAETDFNLPPRCEATCLPRLVKSWNRNTGACECQDSTTWGYGMHTHMIEAGAPESAYPSSAPSPLLFPSNFGQGVPALPPHPHTPETP